MVVFVYELEFALSANVWVIAIFEDRLQVLRDARPDHVHDAVFFELFVTFDVIVEYKLLSNDFNLLVVAGGVFALSFLAVEDVKLRLLAYNRNWAQSGNGVKYLFLVPGEIVQKQFLPFYACL